MWNEMKKECGRATQEKQWAKRDIVKRESNGVCWVCEIARIGRKGGKGPRGEGEAGRED